MHRHALIIAAALLLPLNALAQAPDAERPRRLTPQQERMRSCSAQAREQKLEGEPRTAFMRECLAGHAGPGAAPAGAAPAAASPATPGNAPSVTNPPPRHPSEAAARSACANDEVVWGNTESHVFHARGSRFYGQTRNGGWMCRAQAELSGYREAH